MASALARSDDDVSTGVPYGATPIRTVQAPPSPTPPDAIPSGGAIQYRLTSVDSRFVAEDLIELWGSTDAPDGFPVRVHATAGPRRVRLGDAPAAGGRFYLRARLPRAIRRKQLRIVARLVEA